jgi:ABC-type lipoprotein export system ATPase subunit
MIETITLIGGRGKDGRDEPVGAVELAMGQVVSIVGPTGSGKTTLINDLELMADGSTPSRRRVLVNGRAPDPAYRDDPAQHPVALITQHTNFLSDLPVADFLRIHAAIRHTVGRERDSVIDETLAFANQLTGEPVRPAARMTELSGGQTRALLIADAVVVGNAPIVLLDEIENAGIHRMRALELLRQYRKIFVFVTHDPYIPLLSDYRVVMAGGAMTRVIRSGAAERQLAQRVREADDVLALFRERIRSGGEFTLADVDAGLGAALFDGRTAAEVAA